MCDDIHEGLIHDPTVSRRTFGLLAVDSEIYTGPLAHLAGIFRGQQQLHRTPRMAGADGNAREHPDALRPARREASHASA